jgi:hypothetical protein
VAPTWQGVMMFSVRHKLRPGPCKSLCAPNSVGSFLAHFRFSCYLFCAVPEMFVAHYIGLFYIEPKQSNELDPYCIMLGHFTLGIIHRAFPGPRPIFLSFKINPYCISQGIVLYTILAAADHQHIIRQQNKTFLTSI